MLICKIVLIKEFAMSYWLMKSEPHVYNIDSLEKKRCEMWGKSVRNYQARNMMRDDMTIGDEIFFYQSNCQNIGILGIAKVASKPYPDPTQFDIKSHYYDEKSSKENPRWVTIDVEFVRKFSRVITLSEIKAEKSLEGMILTHKGNRLSITPVKDTHWQKILSLE